MLGSREGRKYKIMKKRLLLFVMTALTAYFPSIAQTLTFTVDGISYKQFDGYNGYEKCVYVTPSAFGKYKGDIVIPDSVTFDGNGYKVLGIGDNSFKDCTELTSVQMDAIVVFIGNYAFENCTGLKELSVRLNTQYYLAPDRMGNGLHVGYRAFYGCRLKSFTLDAHDIPPYYTQRNPSNDYKSVTSNLLNNWFDQNDYWDAYPYSYRVWNYTTFYVPAGHGVDYKYYNNNYPYNEWGYYFGKIKEFGADPYDNVFGMKCDTIPDYILYTDSLMDIGIKASYFAYDYLMQYIDSIAQAEGKQPDYTQLEAALKVDTLTTLIIPEIYSMLQTIYIRLNKADELCDDMKEQRKQYYEAKNTYEMRVKRYPNIDWVEEKADVERKKAALELKIYEMNLLVNQAGAALAYLVDFGDSLFVKEMWDFINAFKLKTSVISPTMTNVQNGRHHWYTLDGKHLDEPSKGINIINGKKIVVK